MAKIKAILLAHIKNKGKPGDIIMVAKGHFNYLERLQKARYATKQALEELEKEKETLLIQDESAKKEAQNWALTLDQKVITIHSQSSDRGILYGSISSRDIAKEIAKEGLGIHPNQILLAEPIKLAGEHKVRIDLHPLVHIDIIISVGNTVGVES